MVVSDPQLGKATTVQLTPQQFSLLIGKKIGDIVSGSHSASRTHHSGLPAVLTKTASLCVPISQGLEKSKSC
jgi:ribosomal protein S6E (S10)